MRANETTATWRDAKRYLGIFGLTMPLLPFLTVLIIAILAAMVIFRYL